MLYGFERCWRAAIAILADECIDGGIFAEFADAWCEHDQFGSVGQGHAGPVDAFVAEPGAAELKRIEENDSLPDLPRHHLKVDLEAQACGMLEAFCIIADVHAADDQLAGRV